MISIELNLDEILHYDVVQKLADNGVLVLLCGKNNQYIRLLPPLNVDKEEIDYFIDTFKCIL